MKAITFFFFLMIVQSHCDVHRPNICECLKEEIDASYKRKASPNLRMKMLLRYDELGCDEVVPFEEKWIFDKK